VTRRSIRPAPPASIEFERGWPLIVDRALYRELAKQAIARTVSELEAKVAQRAAEKKTSRGRGDQPPDPLADARAEHHRTLREVGEQAHGVNLDLGASLLTGLAYVDPADITVARLFVLSSLGPPMRVRPRCVICCGSSSGPVRFVGPASGEALVGG
jgi:hypothetical protein